MNRVPRTPSAGPPAVTAFVLGQLRTLGDEALDIGRMASERQPGAALSEALERFRHHLAAHVLVGKRLLVAPLCGARGYRDLLALEDEHEALEHRAAEIQQEGCPVEAVADCTGAARAHIANAGHVVRNVSAEAAGRLAGVPAWRAEELFECAGGPTGTWPGEWLG